MIHQLTDAAGGVGPLAVIVGVAVALAPWVARWIRFERGLSRRLKSAPRTGWPYW